MHRRGWGSWSLLAVPAVCTLLILAAAWGAPKAGSSGVAAWFKPLLSGGAWLGSYGGSGEITLPVASQREEREPPSGVSCSEVRPRLPACCPACCGAAFRPAGHGAAASKHPSPPPSSSTPLPCPPRAGAGGEKSGAAVPGGLQPAPRLAVAPVARVRGRPAAAAAPALAHGRFSDAGFGCLGEGVPQERPSIPSAQPNPPSPGPSLPRRTRPAATSSSAGCSSCAPASRAA